LRHALAFDPPERLDDRRPELFELAAFRFLETEKERVDDLGGDLDVLRRLAKPMCGPIARLEM